MKYPATTNRGSHHGLREGRCKESWEESPRGAAEAAWVVGGDVVREVWALLRASATNQAGKGPPLAEPCRKSAGKDVHVMQFTGISQGTEHGGKWI